MKLRKAKISDFDEYFHLETIYNKEHSAHDPADFRCTSLDKTKIKTNFLKKIRKQGKLFLVLDDNNKLYGYFYGEISRNKMERYGYQHKKTLFGYIENVFITKPYRRKGYFTLMNNEFITFLRTKRVKYCDLHVNMNNTAAIKTYKKYGFTPTEQKMRLKITGK